MRPANAVPRRQQPGAPSGRGWGPRHLFVTLSCISNEVGDDVISATRWTGVPVRRVLERAAVKPEATYLVISSVDGCHEVVPLELIRSDERIMLTSLWDAKPLPVPHGYPLRIYIPDRYGMKQPEWITGLELAPRLAVRRRPPHLRGPLLRRRRRPPGHRAEPVPSGRGHGVARVTRET